MGDYSQINTSDKKNGPDKNFLKQKTVQGSVLKSDYLKKDSEFLEFKKQINKLLLDEETVQNMEDARESKFYFEKMRCLELCRFTLMVMAQAVAILDYEIEFSSLNDYYAQWFLYITLICSIGLIIMTYFSYEAQNQFIIATKQYGKSATIFNTGKWKLMILEMSIYLVFPQPWFQDIKVYFFVDYHQVRVYHYLNEIFLLIMLLRFLIMVKIILINTKWYTERVSRVCNLYATKMSPLFIIKVNMQKNPMRVFWFCYVFSLFVYSYAVRVCERPLLRDPPPEGKTFADFNQYPNAVWCMMISIPSVGYGDMYPVTSHGRFIAAMSFISGTFMLSVLCNSLIIILDFNSLQAKANLILSKLQVREDIKITATKMFAYVAKIAYNRRHGKDKSQLVARKLRKAAVYFKSINRTYKSLADLSNLVEQMDKQFTYLREEFGNFDESMNQINDAQQSIMKQIQLQYSSLDTQQVAISGINYMGVSQSDQKETFITKRKNQISSVQYYTEDMNDAGIKQKPYNFSYNMINHVHPNQFY